MLKLFLCESRCVSDSCPCYLLEGRTQNAWESPKGCLLFSFTLQMENGRVLPFLQYVISLAMTEAINVVCQKNVSCFLSSSCFFLVFKLEFVMHILGLNSLIFWI